MVSGGDAGAGEGFLIVDSRYLILDMRFSALEILDSRFSILDMRFPAGEICDWRLAVFDMRLGVIFGAGEAV